MTDAEQWQKAGSYDDKVLPFLGAASAGAREALTARPPAQFDRHTWDAVERLIEAIQTGEHAAISRAAGVVMGLNLKRLVGAKQALRVGLWALLTALVVGPATDDSLEEIAERIYRASSGVLNVGQGALVSVMGDALRVMEEDQPTYSLPDGEFVVVSAVVLSELLRIAPPAVASLAVIHDQCQLAFSGAAVADVQSAWLAKINKT